MPRPARSSERKKGDAIRAGWTAEHTSWRKPSQGQRLRAGAAPDGGRALEHLHPEAGPGQRQRGGQAVGARADHDGIDGLGMHRR